MAGLWARKMAGALGAAAAVALIEELAFRGYLLHIALRRLRVVPAAITTSVLYALVHYVRVPRDLGLADRFQPLAGIEVVWGTVKPHDRRSADGSGGHDRVDAFSVPCSPGRSYGRASCGTPSGCTPAPCSSSSSRGSPRTGTPSAHPGSSARVTFMMAPWAGLY